jgi:hypothetical protein
VSTWHQAIALLLLCLLQGACATIAHPMLPATPNLILPDTPERRSAREAVRREVEAREAKVRARKALRQELLSRAIRERGLTPSQDARPSAFASPAKEVVLDLPQEAIEALKRGPRYIVWEEAVQLIRQGRIRLVGEAHSGVVYLQGRDYQDYKTIEPRADDALRVVRDFGNDTVIFIGE